MRQQTTGGESRTSATSEMDATERHGGGDHCHVDPVNPTVHRFRGVVQGSKHPRREVASSIGLQYSTHQLTLLCVCVCVCVCERERERERLCDHKHRTVDSSGAHRNCSLTGKRPNRLSGTTISR